MATIEAIKCIPKSATKTFKEDSIEQVISKEELLRQLQEAEPSFGLTSNPPDWFKDYEDPIQPQEYVKPMPTMPKHSSCRLQCQYPVDKAWHVNPSPNANWNVPQNSDPWKGGLHSSHLGGYELNSYANSQPMSAFAPRKAVKANEYASEGIPIADPPKQSRNAQNFTGFLLGDQNGILCRDCKSRDLMHRASTAVMQRMSQKRHAGGCEHDQPSSSQDRVEPKLRYAEISKINFLCYEADDEPIGGRRVHKLWLLGQDTDNGGLVRILACVGIDKGGSHYLMDYDSRVIREYPDLAPPKGTGTVISWANKVIETSNARRQNVPVQRREGDDVTLLGWREPADRGRFKEANKEENDEKEDGLLWTGVTMSLGTVPLYNQRKIDATYHHHHFVPTNEMQRILGGMPAENQASRSAARKLLKSVMDDGTYVIDDSMCLETIVRNMAPKRRNKPKDPSKPKTERKRKTPPDSEGSSPEESPSSETSNSPAESPPSKRSRKGKKAGSNNLGTEENFAQRKLKFEQDPEQNLQPAENMISLFLEGTNSAKPETQKVSANVNQPLNPLIRSAMSGSESNFQ